METDGLYQLIGKPTKIRNGSMSCIDLIITDQPNMSVEYGVHLLLYGHCQHQIIFGNVNMSLPSLLPYRRIVWYYKKANLQSIKNSVINVDWVNSLNPPFTPSEIGGFSQRLCMKSCLGIFKVKLLRSAIRTCPA